MPKAELLPVTYDPEKLNMWADENFRRIVDALNAVGSVPIGGVTLWWGAATAVPTGWAICDGTNGTPDLRGRVPVGVSTDTEFDTLGETGGSKTVTLTTAQIESHAHAIDHNHAAVTSGGGSSHGHSVNSHNHGGGTGVHAHELSGRVRTSTTAHEHDNTEFQFAGRPTGSISFTDSANPTTNSVGIGNTFETPGTTTDNSHTHSVDVANLTGTSGNAGSTQGHSNLQPYIALHFIMRVS